MNKINKDHSIALVFFLLTILVIYTAMTNISFFDWAFDRHYNQWSWHIRPIFLIPFCFFAYKRRWSGISISIFCLITSMFWFDKPDIVDKQIVEFLQFEKEWLQSSWNYEKVIAVVSIPVSLFLLALAFWKRSILVGLGIMVLIAAGKVIWSIQNAGQSGKSIIIPAIFGLIICTLLVYFGFKKLEKK